MFVLFGGLTALCAFAAATGQPIGFIGVLVFGGGGAVYFYLANPGRGRASWEARARARHGTLPGAGRHTSKPVGVVSTGRREPGVTQALSFKRTERANGGLIPIRGANPVPECCIDRSEVRASRGP